ncbi:uncharacterized protein VTP21DRAFT_1718 [Calcarisporiella thermophila]|uniref:uncharacterized protein n=1 Tax=Calcarisporiella thermophila TaxID=911321 RepID=UPI00374438BE
MSNTTNSSAHSHMHKTSLPSGAPVGSQTDSTCFDVDFAINAPSSVRRKDQAHGATETSEQSTPGQATSSQNTPSSLPEPNASQNTDAKNQNIEQRHQSIDNDQNPIAPKGKPTPESENPLTTSTGDKSEMEQLNDPEQLKHVPSEIARDPHAFALEMEKHAIEAAKLAGLLSQDVSSPSDLHKSQATQEELEKAMRAPDLFEEKENEEKDEVDKLMEAQGTKPTAANKEP